jgi:D-psicose/D-tagatose/L-ribulose 3-epimerase
MRFGIHYRLWSRAWSDADLDLIQHARDLGYSVFEITISNLPQINAKAIRQRAEAAGIEIVSTISLAKDRALASPDPTVRQQGIAFLRAAVERVREMNCRLLVGMTYGTPGLFTGNGPTADELRWVAEGLQHTAEFAKAYDVTLALEPVNRYETYLLNTAAQAQALVDAIGEKNVGLHLDTYHMNIEERGIPDTLRRHRASLRHLHLNESDRGLLGGGNVDWKGVFDALRDIQYAGIVSIECFSFVSPEVPAITPIWRTLFPSPDELARRGLAFLSKGLGDLY